MIPGLSDKNVVDFSPFSKVYVFGKREYTFETGRFAKLAQGAAVISDDSGNLLLTTVGINPEAKDASFFPLTVEFVEKYYAAGKIGGNRFMKREGRPSEAAILNSRLIDRPIRPMFPKGVQNEVQVISTILSSSNTSDFGFWGITGASLGFMLAGAKEFEGPVAGARIAWNPETGFVFDPNFEQIQNATIDLTIAGTLDAITMVESQSKEASEASMLAAFEFAFECVKTICQAQLDFIAEYSKKVKLPECMFTLATTDSILEERVAALVTANAVEPLFNTGKIEFYDRLSDLSSSVYQALSEEDAKKEATEGNDTDAADEIADDVAKYSESIIADLVYGQVKKHMRAKVLTETIRLDGRRPSEIRPLRSSISVLPRTHGSGLFERGVTQVLSVTTLGGPGDIQIIDDMFEENTKRYIHHYNFPPYSVGEVRPLRGTGRREIGHGRLAEKALEPVLPTLEEFPYFIRVVSETLTCNGSSSMASVCGSTLSLMDAGVPIKSPVSGVAMGMIFDEETRKYVVLTDIQAQEDFLGDLDFKIAGTKQGITALQMDCKIAGLELTVIRDVFSQATVGLEEIRSSMLAVIAEPRKELSPYAPLIFSLFVPEEKMREVIGKGGETIQGIEKDFGVKVDLEDSGQCSITAKDQVSGKAAYDFIQKILKVDEVGDVLEGKVVKILEGVGAIVEWGKNKSGMVHISKLGVKERVEQVEKYVSVGQVVQVKILAIDTEKGRVSLERIV